MILMRVEKYSKAEGNPYCLGYAIKETPYTGSFPAYLVFLCSQPKPGRIRRKKQKLHTSPTELTDDPM